MQINNNGITNNTANGSANTQKTAASAKAENSSSAAATSGDSVELSQAAKSLTELESKINASADVDTNRVADIRQAIADGNYSIDADKIAAKLLASDELF